MATETLNSIYRDGKLIKRGVPTTEVKKEILNDAKNNPSPGNPQIYRVKRGRLFDGCFRIMRGRVTAIKKDDLNSN